MHVFFVLLFVGGLVLLFVWANEQELKAERRRKNLIRSRTIRSNIKTDQTPSEKQSAEPTQKKKSLTSKERTSDGKTFVFAGMFEKLPRDEARRLLEKAGGINSALLSKGTDYLVVGDNPGSKASKAKTLGIEIINEDEFLELIDHKIVVAEKPDLSVKKKKEIALSFFSPSQYLPGGGFLGESDERYEKPATFYVIRIEVPMDDGSTFWVHKPGICVGKVLGGRYPQKAPIEVWVEIPNLHRSVARTLEGKMLLIMNLLPWNPQLHFDLLMQEVDMTIKWNEDYEVLNQRDGYLSHDWVKGIKKRRSALYDSYFKGKGISRPKIPKSWEKQYGLTEWCLWTGDQAELKETVDYLLLGAKEFFVPKAYAPNGMSELHLKWANSKYRPTDK